MKLQLDAVSVRYGARMAVDAVSFTLPAGGIGCLLGASGSGKTSLLRVIAGLEPASSGRLLGDAQDFSREPAEQRNIGLVFQDLALLPHLNVTDNIGFGLHRQSAAQRQARVTQLLELVGLSAYALAYPHELSGGQQQRVALARALAPRPRLLLLDEPFSSLDPDLRAQLAGDVHRILSAEGSTALMVTHSQEEAFAFGDHIGVMHQGRLLQWGDAHTLYGQPACRQVAQFIGGGSLLRVQRRGGLLETELGPVPAPGPDQALELLLRAEDVMADAKASVHGEILSRRFLGAEYLYVVKLDSGTVLPLRDAAARPHAVGTRLGLRLALQHLITFEA